LMREIGLPLAGKYQDGYNPYTYGY
jgi:hypothetical protein